MKIRMVTLAAGPGGIYAPGAIVDLDEAIAAAMVAGGYAVLVGVSPVSPSVLPELGREIAVDTAPKAASRRRRK